MNNDAPPDPVPDKTPEPIDPVLPANPLPPSDDRLKQQPSMADPADIPSVLPAEDDAADVLLAEPAPPKHRLSWYCLVLAGVTYIACFVHGGELRLIAFAGLQSVPFVVLALFAYAGQRHVWARIVTLISLAIIVGLSGFLDFVLALALKRREPWPALVTFAGVVSAFLAAVICFAPRVRQQLGRLVPIDPTSFVHATALATVTALTINAFLPLIVLGEPPVVAIVERVQQSRSQDSRDEDLRTQIYGTAWLVPTAFLVVGYPVRRGFRDTCQRLGLVRPRLWQVAFAIVAPGILLVAMHYFQWATERIWRISGWPVTDDKLLRALFGGVANPLGAMAIGVAAGLGEELAVRGVLQPRVGIFLSNLLFAALHAFQYHWDAVLGVFLFGLILAFIRKWTNTSTSALVHGLYDCLSLLLMYLGMEY